MMRRGSLHIYIINTVTYKIVNELTFNIDEYLETISIVISQEKQ